VTVIRRRRTVRKWRSRGRRGQVAAVATILGLLLVVTFIANYLTTTLPNQMTVNDLDHDLQVENQLGRFQALLEQVSSIANPGAQVTAPITLGSSGAPPFADADSGQIGPLNGSSFRLAYTVVGPYGYQPPTGGTPNSGNLPTADTCVTTGAPPTTLTCTTGSGGVRWNFTASTPTTYAITTASGPYFFNVTDSGASSSSHASITFTPVATNPLEATIIGSNDTISVVGTAASTDVFVIVGSNDTLSYPDTTAATTVVALVVGVNDAVTFATVTANVKFWGAFFGFDDSANAGTDSSTANAFHVYFNGFYPANPATYCPVGTIARTTDTVAGGTSGKGTFAVTFNDTTATAGAAPPAPWTAVWSAPPSFACPFEVQVMESPSSVQSAGIDVHLLNTYAPLTDLAFDAGGIVYAQPGGVPLLVDPPGISIRNSASGVTSASIWFPIFQGQVASEAGISTADMSARLVSNFELDLTPKTSYQVANNTIISIAITTPFASGWWSYFNATYPASWLACTGNGCLTPYTGLGDFGTVTLNIPTGVNLRNFQVDVAAFSFSLI
jgi:hypothetical protein